MPRKLTYDELEKQVLELKNAELGRQRMEPLLRDEIARWRLMFEQSRDGIVILDQNGKVYEANKRYSSSTCRVVLSVTFLLPPLSVQREIVAGLEAERKLVEGNRGLIRRMEGRIKAKLDEVWGE